jgi:hypothetical protein
MKTTRLALILCGIALASSLATIAADKGEKNKKKSSPNETAAHPEGHQAEAKREIGITVTEREIIRGYCVQIKKPGKKGMVRSLPPGLAKKVARGGRLPPGWEKKLVKGETIPVEVFREECHPLPTEVVIRLPEPPPGTILRAIQGTIVRLHEKTREILDVFDPFH